MPPRLKSIFLFCLLALLPNFAEASDFESETTAQKAFVVAGIEGAQLTSTASSLTGVGPHASVNYFVSDRISINPGVSMVFGSTSSSLLYTEVEANAQYTFWGAPLKGRTSIKLNNTERMSVLTPSPSRFAANLGIMQFFLNGTSSVYPSTGVGVGAVYDHQFFGAPIELELRYARLTSNRQDVNGLILRLQFYFDI